MKQKYPWNTNSEEYRKFTDTREYDGLTVNRMGIIFGKSGRRLKSSFTERNSISVFYKNEENKTQCRSYQRLVYKAWNPDFDIDDMSLVVVSKDRNPFDKEPHRLEVITLEQHRKEFVERNTLYSGDAKKQVKDIWDTVKSDPEWNIAKLARELNMNYKTLYALLVEDIDG